MLEGVLEGVLESAWRLLKMLEGAGEDEDGI